MLKLVLGLVALAIVVRRHRSPGKLAPEKAGQLLGVMALVAALAWCNFGMLHGTAGIHHWELFHYFLGSKYFPELGYDGLYSASLAAEHELGLNRSLPPYARDLRSNEVVRVDSLEEHGREVKSRFSADRWNAFVADNGYFVRANTVGYLGLVRRDHGYNPTPTWSFVARLASAWLMATPTTLTVLAWLDPILLVFLFIAIWRSFGSRAACMCAIVFGLGYPWRYHFVGGAFLRHDWFVAVGLAACALRNKHHAAAGCALAYASMVRIFPAAFLFGPALLTVRHLIRRQPLRWARRLAAGFSIGIVLCLAMGSLSGRGPEAWPEFLRNLDKHRGTWLTNNVGLANVLLYDLDTMRRTDVRWELPEPWLFWQEKMNLRAAALRPWTIAAAGLLLALTALAGWRERLPDSFILGIPAIFALVLLTCYYWVMLALLPLNRNRWGPTAGWLSLNAFLFVANLLTPSFEMIYGLMSWGLLLFFVVWLGPQAWTTVKELRFGKT